MMTVSPLVVMEHVVLAEETLADVAGWYGVTAVYLHMLNNLPSVTVQAGQALLVPVMLAYFQPQVMVKETAVFYPKPGKHDGYSTLLPGTVVTVQAQTVDSRWYWVAVDEKMGWMEKTAVI